MNTKYVKNNPKELFAVVVETIVKHDTPTRMHYEYRFRVEVRPLQNDFINLLAELIIRYGRCELSVYAKLMGVSEHELSITLVTLTGGGIREFADSFAVTVAETLLRETFLPVGKIAAAAGWKATNMGLNSFSRWFVMRYKCPPLQWRKMNTVS